MPPNRRLRHIDFVLRDVRDIRFHLSKRQRSTGLADDIGSAAQARAMGSAACSARAAWARCASCSDGRIGREVALKKLATRRGASADARARFVREARVQGQLEHPAIVPVYDLGAATGRQPYFTMKRVRGQTLGRDHRRSSRRATRRWQARFRAASCSRRSPACAWRSTSRTRAACFTATSSPATSCSATSARCTCSTGAWRARSRRPRPDEAHRPCGAQTADGKSDGRGLGTPGYMAPEQAAASTNARRAHRRVLAGRHPLRDLYAGAALRARSRRARRRRAPSPATSTRGRARARRVRQGSAPSSRRSSSPRRRPASRVAGCWSARASSTAPRRRSSTAISFFRTRPAPPPPPRHVAAAAGAAAVAMSDDTPAADETQRRGRAQRRSVRRWRRFRPTPTRCARWCAF